MIFGLDTMLIIALSGLFLQIELFEGIDGLIHTVTGVFSILLLALSISAYKKTGLKKINYAAIAFALFGIQLLIQSLEDTIEVFDTGYTSLIISSMTLAILVLFFLAIVQRNK
ncbi:MAG: hypothetical protein WCF46_14995 [Nitrososphaeraceae archaeon]